MQVDIIVHSTLNSSYLHFLTFTEDILTQAGYSEILLK